MDVDYSCYEGREVQGGSDVVLSRGTVIVEDDQWLGHAGHGKFLRREPRGFAESRPAPSSSPAPRSSASIPTSSRRSRRRPATRAGGSNSRPTRHALWPALRGHFGRGQGGRATPENGILRPCCRRPPATDRRSRNHDRRYVGRARARSIPPTAAPDAVRRPDRGGPLPVLLRRAVRAGLPDRASTSRRSSARSRPATSRAAPGRSSPPTRSAPPAAPPVRSSDCARAPASASASIARSRSDGSSATPSRRLRPAAARATPPSRRPRRPAGAPRSSAPGRPGWPVPPSCAGPASA